MIDNNNQFSETLDNTPQPGAEYDVFSENSQQEKANAEFMNRDYLHHIYNEDMRFLNKEIKMTRSQYNNEIAEIEKIYKNEMKQNKKRVIFTTVISVILLIVALFFFTLWIVNTAYYAKLTANTRFGNLFIPPQQLRGNWAFAGFFGTIAWALFCIDIAFFSFFTVGFLKTTKKIKATKKRSLETLETRKREIMMLGQYDASR